MNMSVRSSILNLPSSGWKTGGSGGVDPFIPQFSTVRCSSVAARLKSCTVRTNRILLAPRNIVEQAQVLAHQVLPQLVYTLVPLVVSFLVREVAVLGLVAVFLPQWVLPILSLLRILAAVVVLVLLGLVCMAVSRTLYYRALLGCVISPFLFNCTPLLFFYCRCLLK